MVRSRVLLGLSFLLLVACRGAPRQEATDAQADGDSPTLGGIASSVTVSTSGDANLALSLILPPGIANTGPSLSIGYSSAQPNGTLGVGMQLQGLSTITRVGANVSQDGFRGGVNYDANDRFALDGERLIVIQGQYGAPGSVYRTEIESWRQVIANGDPRGQPCGSGPCTFTVYSADGSTKTYGGAGNSAVLAMGQADVRVWGLSSVITSNGNTTLLQYLPVPYAGGTQDGQLYPGSIAYSSNGALQASRSLTFEWEARDDVDASYQGGSAYSTTARLHSITAYVQQQAVRQYRIAYGYAPVTSRSRVNSVVECSSDTGQECLPDTTLGWQDVQASFSAPASWSGDFVPPIWTASYPRQLADVNGDGRLDIVGFGTDTEVGLANATGSGFLASASWNSGFGSPAWTSSTPRQLADVNGDGLADVVGFAATGVMVAPSSGSAFDASLWSSAAYAYFGSDPSAGGWSLSQNPRMIADVNGDGLADIVGFLGTSGSANGVWVGCSQGSSFQVPSVWNASDFTGASWYSSTDQMRVLGDVNGDGLADIVGFGANSVLVGLSTGKPAAGASSGCAAGSSFDTTAWPQNASGFNFFTLGQGWTVGSNPRQLADVNGDGLMDIVGFRNGVQVALSNGRGFDAPTTWNAGFSIESVPSWSSSQPRVLADIDGDGLPDIIGVGSQSMGGVNVALSTGSAFVSGVFDSAALANILPGNGATTVLFGDVSGDGLTDVVSLGTLFTDATQVYVGVSPGPQPDLVVEVDNGQGNLAQLDYVSLALSAVYTQSEKTDVSAATAFTASPATVYNSQSATYPVQPVVSPRRVVVSGLSNRSLVDGDLPSYSYSDNYSYSNGLYDVLAQRWLGFQSRTVDHASTGAQEVQTYSQVWPTQSQVLTNDTYCGPGSPALDPSCVVGARVKGQINTYTALPTATGSGPTATVVYDVFSASNQVNFYTYGRFDQGYRQVFTPNSYGDPIRIDYQAEVSESGQATPTPADFSTCIAYVNLTAMPWHIGTPSAQKQTTLSANCATPDTFQTGDLGLTTYTYDVDPSGPNGARMNLLTSSVWDQTLGINLVTRYGYDDYGNVLTYTKPNNATWVTTFDPVHQTYPVETTMPAIGQQPPMTTQASYDPATGARLGQSDPNGNSFFQCTDTFNRPVAVQGPVPAGVQNPLLAPPCLPSRATNTSGLSQAQVTMLSTLAYPTDGAGVVYTQTQDQQSWATTSDAGTQLWTLSFKDGLGRSVATLREGMPSLGNILQCHTYDQNGNLLSQSLPAYIPGDSPTCDAPSLLWRRWTYNVLGHPTQVSRPAGSDGLSEVVTTYAYPDSFTTIRTTTGSDGSNYAQTLVYAYFNSQLRLLAVQNSLPQSAPTTTCYPPAGLTGQQSYSYDPLARLVGTTDPAGVATTISYDSVGRKSKMVLDGIGTQTWVYDNQGNLHQAILPTGTTTYGYDALGRTTSVVRGDTTISRFYDGAVANGLGNLTSATRVDSDGASTAWAFTYDPYSRQAGQSLTPGAGPALLTATNYDPVGRPVLYTWPDGSVLRRQIDYGNLSALTVDGQPYVALSDYTPMGQPQSLSWGAQGAGGRDTRSYAPTGALLGLDSVDAAGNPTLSLDYSWNGLMLLSSVTDSLRGNIDRTQSFNYENLQLASASGSYGALQYRYDAAANMVQAGSTSFRYSGQQVIEAKDASCAEVFSGSYTNGSLTSRSLNGSDSILSYDDLNLLDTVVSDGATLMDNAYDYQDQRLSGRGTNGASALYVDAQTIQRTNGGDTSLVKLLTDLNGVALTQLSADSSGALQLGYIHADDLRSTLMVSGAQGQVLEEYLYQPYGAQTASGSGLVQPTFTGKEWDAGAGLYWMGARFYDPALGRFVSADTELATDTDFMGTLNRYAYSGNNPVNVLDPSGHNLWGLLGGLFNGNYTQNLSGGRALNFTNIQTNVDYSTNPMALMDEWQTTSYIELNSFTVTSDVTLTEGASSVLAQGSAFANLNLTEGTAALRLTGGATRLGGLSDITGTASADLSYGNFASMWFNGGSLSMRATGQATGWGFGLNGEAQLSGRIIPRIFNPGTIFEQTGPIRGGFNLTDPLFGFNVGSGSGTLADLQLSTLPGRAIGYSGTLDTAYSGLPWLARSLPGSQSLQGTLGGSGAIDGGADIGGAGLASLTDAGAAAGGTEAADAGATALLALLAL